MQIRSNCDSDKPFLRKLINDIYLEFVSLNQGAQFNWPSDKTDSLFSHYKFIVTFGENNEPLAFICYQDLSGDVDVIALGVSPLKRRAGLMRTLFQYFVENVCKAGSKILLEVHEGNLAALRMYEKSGFCIDGIRKNYYSDGSAALNLSADVGKLSI